MLFKKLSLFNLKDYILGNSLVVQWLGCALIAVAQVRSLVGELRFHKPHGTAKN